MDGNEEKMCNFKIEFNFSFLDAILGFAKKRFSIFVFLFTIQFTLWCLDMIWEGLFDQRKNGSVPERRKKKFLKRWFFFFFGFTVPLQTIFCSFLSFAVLNYWILCQNSLIVQLFFSGLFVFQIETPETRLHSITLWQGKEEVELEDSLVNVVIFGDVSLLLPSCHHHQGMLSWRYWFSLFFLLQKKPFQKPKNVLTASFLDSFFSWT